MYLIFIAYHYDNSIQCSSKSTNLYVFLSYKLEVIFSPTIFIYLFYFIIIIIILYKDCDALHSKLICE